MRHHRPASSLVLNVTDLTVGIKELKMEEYSESTVKPRAIVLSWEGSLSLHLLTAPLPSALFPIPTPSDCPSAICFECFYSWLSLYLLKVSPKNQFFAEYNSVFY